MTFTGGRRWSIAVAVAGFALAAVLCFPARAEATVYYGNYFNFEVEGQSVHIVRDVSECPTTGAGFTHIYVDYDWDFDGSWIANWEHVDDKGAPDYDKQLYLAGAANQIEWSFPLDPKFQVYFLNIGWNVGSDWYMTQGVVVNSKAEVVVANSEPTPVRIQEIGLASEAATLAADVLPVSLDASVSINTSETTLPVAVTSVLGESDGVLVWSVIGLMAGLGVFLLMRAIGGGCRD